MRALIAAIALIWATASSAGEAPQRIVSLAPNVTETLFAMGLGEKVVGVTTFCDYPPEAGRKPKVGGMSNPSVEAVVSARPDIVVMTTDGNPQGFDRRLNGLGIKTYVLRARRIAELPEEIRGLGKALGAGAQAEELAGGVERALQSFKAASPKGKRVLFVIWPEPLIAAGPGTEVDDVIALLGYENAASDAGINYPRYSVEEALRRMPDIIVVGRGAGMENPEALTRKLRERLRGTPAVRDGNVFYSSDMLYRLGPRVVEGIKELSELLKRAK